MDALLDRCYLGRHSSILASQHLEAQPRHPWNAIILLIGNDRKQLRRTVAALCRDNTELGQMPPDRVRQHRTLTNKKLPATVQHQARLLLLRFRCDKSHRRPRHSLADGSRVVGVVLAAL